MINKRLYIIGNGFDVYHGINSKYSNFRDFVEKNNYDLFRELDEYFDTDDLWSDFEETLAYINTDRIIDEASNFLERYGSEDWSEYDNFAYQNEIERRVNFITIDLKRLFTEWILQLVLPPESIEKKIQIEKNSKFISFNYTDTLERLYRVSFNSTLTD
jgi:hypothetical protein